MENSDQVSHINIDILSLADADVIDAEAWDTLSQKSIYHNPFYERWNLLPALHHLAKKDDVFVVILTNNKQLVGLFPVIILHFHKTVKYLSMWLHDHCYLTDQLLSQNVDFRNVVNQVGKRLGANWFLSPMHSPQLMAGGRGVYYRQFFRAAITDSALISKHLDDLGGKYCRENRRIVRKIYNNFYVKHIEHQDILAGLTRYSELEHQGWKGKKSGSILSHEHVKNYYFEMAQRADARKHIIFHELWADDKLVGITIRFTTQGYWFDIKTSYNEEYKRYSPGKVLEIKNLMLLENQSFKRVDSCTSSDNSLINKLWPEQLMLYSSHIFFDYPKSQWWHFIYRAKKAIDILKLKFR